MDGLVGKSVGKKKDESKGEIDTKTVERDIMFKQGNINKVTWVIVSFLDKRYFGVLYQKSPLTAEKDIKLDTFKFCV